MKDDPARIIGAEEQFRLLANNAPVLIWMSAPDKRLIWFNDPWLRFVGRSLEQEIGDRWVENVHPDDLASCLETYATAFDARQPISREFRLKRHDGEYRWLLDNGNPSYGLGGEFTGYIGSCIDVSDRKLAQQEHAYAGAIIASSDDAILSKTLQGIITSWNAGAERMFGFRAEEAIGRSIEIIIPSDRLEEEREILERLRRGERIEHYETMRRTKGGRLLHISLTISPVKDESGRIIGASKIARDITERKRVETELVEATRRKDEFIAILAHELRNPLAPVINAAHYLKLKGPEDPDLRRSIEMIDRQVVQMARLIEDLLDMSRISRGVLGLRLERLKFSEVAEAALDACRDQIQAQGHKLHVALPSKPLELEADRERLVQVLCNLIVNAAKYTPRGGRIEVRAMAGSPDLEVSVKDNGIGIPPEKLGDIFELFARVDTSLEPQKGLGIGLTLARQLVELHGGSIEARSEGIGKGSEFVLKLPVATAESKSAVAQVPEPEPAIPPCRILIVDDSEDAVESLALLLKIEGHDIHKAFDGQAAIALAEVVRPDVLLLDIGMPGMNGYEAARRIREQSWGKEIYLVALTGWGQEADKRRAQEAGFNDHLVKPIAPEALNRIFATTRGRAGERT